MQFSMHKSVSLFLILYIYIYKNIITIWYHIKRKYTIKKLFIVWQNWYETNKIITTIRYYITIKNLEYHITMMLAIYKLCPGPQTYIVII